MNDTPWVHASTFVLGALAAATLTASLGISVASVLLPSLTRAFAASVSDVRWIVLAYLMSVTVAIVSAGRLGDLFGHRRMLVAGLVVFSAASVLCATAPSLGLLIAGRAAQGLGAAFLIASDAHRPDDQSLRDWCRQEMANYKIPRRFSWLDELPLNASGKVLKTTLRGML